MKIPVYTQDQKVQDATAKQECKFLSREERTLARKTLPRFRSRQDLLNWGMEHDGNKFKIGRYLADYLQKLSVKSILSLGCGECYHEHAIKLAAPEIKITATDFDPFVVEKVLEFLPEIDNVEVFDIKKDDFAKFQGKFDAILILNVEGSLSDDEIVGFFRRIPVVGARHILMTSGAYLTSFQVLEYMIVLRLSKLKWFLLRWETRPPLGRCQAWSRSKGKFVKLIKQAGTVKLHRITTRKPLSRARPLFHITILNQ